jgi:hypothetical protein
MFPFSILKERCVGRDISSLYPSGFGYDQVQTSKKEKLSKFDAATVGNSMTKETTNAPTAAPLE